MSTEIAAIVRESGLVSPGQSAVVLVSGGADSACAAAGIAETLGPERVAALHLDYGLRPDSGEDAATAARLCERLGIELEIERPELADGNVQAAARAARYAAAEEMASRLDRQAGPGSASGAGAPRDAGSPEEPALVVTGHTRTDLAETVLYRLATSPGRRALLGLPARRGRIVRPLLAVSRERVRELAAEAALPFRDDPTNQQPLYARNRIRSEVLPVLRELSPAAEETIATTRAELAEEAEALEALAEEALERAGAGHGAAAVSAVELEQLHPALRRLALRSLAERTAGEPVALAADQAERILALAGKPEGGMVELGGGVEASVEHGHIRFVAAREPGQASSSELGVPGRCTFGAWELHAELVERCPRPAGPETAALDPAKLEPRLEVRAWSDGDRMRPLGLGGSKSLQDLFTDAKVPRSLRRQLPVVISGGRIAWVAGVAVSDEFRREEEEGEAVLLTATAIDPPPPPT